MQRRRAVLVQMLSPATRLMVYYVTVGGVKHLADELMTSESLTQGYTLKWTPNLTLGHMVTFTQLLNDDVVVDHGSTLGTIPMLAPYLTVKNKYGLISASNSSQHFGADTAVLHDMAIVVKPLVRVIIEFGPGTNTGGDDDDETILRLLENVTNCDIIGIEVERDSKNQVIEIVAFVESEEVGKVVILAVDSLEKGAGCDSGVLCRAKRAYMDYELPSSAARRAPPRSTLLHLFCLAALAVSWFARC
jgi:hypothetical protein